MAHLVRFIPVLVLFAVAQSSDTADGSIPQGFLNQGNYNEFLTGGVRASTVFDKTSHSAAVVQAEEKKAVQTLLTNDRGMGIGMPAIGVSLLALAAMMGVRMRRGLQQATAGENILEMKAQEATGHEGNFRSRGWGQNSSENSRALTSCYAESPAFDSPMPAQIVQAATDAGAKKATLPVDQMLVRGALSGLLLGVATSFMITVNITSWGKAFAPVLGAVYFPVGFVMLVLMGCELVTGNMALIPMAVKAGKAKMKGLFKNWSWVTLGNLIGSLMYAGLIWGVCTSVGANVVAEGTLGAAIKGVAVNKTRVYQALGMKGWLTCLIKAICCNWLVTMGTLMSFASKSTIGRIAAMWMPITVFVAHGFEHAVVNFFVIPCGMMFGADVSIFQWLFWNQIPVLLGNIIGGSCLSGLPFAYAYPASKGDTSPVPKGEDTSAGSA